MKHIDRIEAELAEAKKLSARAIKGEEMYYNECLKLGRRLVEARLDVARMDAFGRFFTDTVRISDPITNKEFEGADLRQAIDNYMAQERLN